MNIYWYIGTHTFIVQQKNISGTHTFLVQQKKISSTFLVQLLLYMSLVLQLFCALIQVDDITDVDQEVSIYWSTFNVCHHDLGYFKGYLICERQVIVYIQELTFCCSYDHYNYILNKDGPCHLWIDGLEKRRHCLERILLICSGTKADFFLIWTK